MDLSIIIVNYNVRDLLVDAIESVRAASAGLSTEIIVVDNASTDGAVELLGRDFPDVTVIPLERNIGFGRANNIGIGIASGEYILLLNPDTVVEEDTLRSMIRFMDDHPAAGVASSRILKPDGRLEAAAIRGFPSPWSAFTRIVGLSRLFPGSRMFGRYNQTWRNPEETQQVEAISGCFMFYRGDVLRELGGFDDDFFMYGEDLDLCRRTGLAGWKIWYYPETSIVHIQGESTRRSSLDSIRMFYDAMEIFARKHFHHQRFLLPFLRFGIRLRLGLARLTRLFPRGWFALIDIAAVLIGLIIASIIRTGAVSFPESTIPWVFIAPPVPFVIAIGMAGGYGADHARLSRVLLGYLGGFFILSTLPYFFEAYRFSRGIVLATTAIGAMLGLSLRFVTLLYQRTFGRESRRRIAILGTIPPTGSQRNRLRRLFLGRPVRVVGVIAPRFSDLDRLGDEGLGTVENIARIVDRERLSDIVVLDRSISYGVVIGGIRNAAPTSVRFHLMKEGDEGVDEEIPGEHRRGGGGPYRRKAPVLKRLQDRFLAALLLISLPIWPILGRRVPVPASSLVTAFMGGRPLIGAGRGDPGGSPVFGAADLYGGDTLSDGEVAEIGRYYATHRTFLLDCEILVASLQESSGAAAARSAPVGDAE